MHNVVSIAVNQSFTQRRLARATESHLHLYRSRKEHASCPTLIITAKAINNSVMLWTIVHSCSDNVPISCTDGVIVVKMFLFLFYIVCIGVYLFNFISLHWNYYKVIWFWLQTISKQVYLAYLEETVNTIMFGLKFILHHQ